MKRISKAVYTKSMIAASVMFCIGMGQNCAQPQFSAIDGNKVAVKDGGVVTPDAGQQVSPAQPSAGQQHQSTEVSGPTFTGDEAPAPTQTASEPSTDTTNPPVEPQSMTSTNPPSSGSGGSSETPSQGSEPQSMPPVAGGTIQDSGSTTSASNGTTPGETSQPTPPAAVPNTETASSTESDEDCMKVEKIEKEHLPKVATFDEDHKPNKILICHVAGQSGKSHELLLPLPAVTAHLAHHHDYLGTCGQPAVKSCHPKADDDDKDDHKVAKHDDDDQDEHKDAKHEDKDDKDDQDAKDDHKDKKSDVVEKESGHENEQAQSQHGGCKKDKG